ncbi:MAG TPA: FHA domain-containing protein [Myxococcota bacterium]|nr:FHA domain-containing protein [Myxococcota bacterium]HNH48275.1 FHA domain-containing protein [Myxococcota bacterium]
MKPRVSTPTLNITDPEELGEILRRLDQEPQRKVEEAPKPVKQGEISTIELSGRGERMTPGLLVGPDPGGHRSSMLRPVRIPTLRVVSGRDMLHFINLFPGEEVILGREETATLVLADASVSRRHVRVTCSAEGEVVVQDLKSLNGTSITDDLMVKGQQIDKATLLPNCWLEVGGVVVHLEMLNLEQLGHLERMVARLEDSKREPGTGLLPTSWLESGLPELMRRHQRTGRPLSCVLVEPDQLDSLRVRFGEQVMKDVATGVARLVMWKVRETDFCIHYSPRVTLVLLPEVSLSTAAVVSERLRRELIAYRWPRPLAGSRVMVSTGLAEWDGHEPMGDWIGRAFAMLESGRRRSLRLG